MPEQSFLRQPIDKKDYNKTSKCFRSELLKAQRHIKLSGSARGDPCFEVAMRQAKGGSKSSDFREHLTPSRQWNMWR